MRNKTISYKSPFIIGAFLLFNIISSAKESHSELIYISSEKAIYHKSPNPIKNLLFRQQRNNKIAALLAFPFPFGCVGLHRVYLKTSPYVPIVYAATAGGIFGIIPLIDCVVLLSKKDIQQYENNPRVIMWIKPSSKHSSNPE